MSGPAMLGRAALPLALLLLPAAAWAQSSAAPFTIGYRYDAGGRQAGVILPDPDGAPNPLKYAATRNSYDANGNLWKVEKGELQAWQDETILPVNWSGFTVFQTETIAYDTRGRKIRTSIIGPDGTTVYGVTQYSYDDYDRPVCATVRMNPAEFATPPADACTQGSQGADRITKTGYDTFNRVTTIKKALGTPREQTYTTYTYSAMYALSDLDKPASITDANGNTTTMVYGGSVFNHITRMNFPSPTTPGQASATDYEAYTYDANGNRLSARKRNSCVIGYTYDALNRMTKKDMPNGVIGGVDCGTAPDVYYGYDLRGLQLYARFGSVTGTGITNSYDGFGRQKSTMSDVYGPPRTFNYQWDADGNRTQLAFQNGLYYTYDYDDLDRLTRIRVGGTSTDIDTIVTDTYDPQGRRATETRGAVTTTYGYDEVSRLKSISDHFAGDVGKDVTTTFGRNPASQIVRKDRSNDLYAFGDYVSVSRSYAVNGLNQYTSASPASFTYDANGNLIGDGTQTYTYDVENRLIAKSGGTGGSASLDYDPLGRLWRVTLPAKVITFTYDGDAMVTEQNGGALYRFVHGNGEDDPLVWFDGPSATAEHLRSNQVDHQGSVVSTANASGVATAINSYDEYGIPDADNSGRFQYTGQIWLPEVGLYYYKARMYSPTLGRFMQTDPIGYKDQINLYAYVGNDPLDGRDPTGTQVVGTYYSDSGLTVMTDQDTGQTLVGAGFSGSCGTLYCRDAVPVGDYALLAGAGDNSYRLERLDNNFGDDRTPEGPGDLRFHPHGHHSYGCITCHPGQGGDAIGTMLQSTNKGTVVVNYRGRNIFSSNFWTGKESVAQYGRLRVAATGPYRYDEKTRTVTIVTSPARGNRREVTQYYCTIQSDGSCKK